MFRNRRTRNRAADSVTTPDLCAVARKRGRRDVTPHHLVFRAAGGDDSSENVVSLCLWCHLEGVHAGRLAVDAPASDMHWRIGRSAHTVVTGRVRLQAPAHA